MNKSTVKRRPSCATDFDQGVVSVDDALSRILESVRPIQGSETLDIRSALGRVIAKPVLSTIDVPSHTNSAVDGYALRGNNLSSSGDTVLKLIGTSFAGTPFDGKVGEGECARIMTGAVMPSGADTVVMQEDVEAEGATVRIGDGHKQGQHVRQAGEDIQMGQTALSEGKWVGPAELGLLASLGVPEVEVKREVRVALLSTGDELRPVGEPLGKGDIYDSNRYSLTGLLRRLGVEILDLGIIPDQREATRQAFQEAGSKSDVIITSGGVSVGEADFVKEILDELGAVNFWKIAIKPGRPLAFGSLGETFFFGLPGNPVAAMVTFYQFVQPALRRMMGMNKISGPRFTVLCLADFRKRPGRTEYQRGILERQEDGTLAVKTTGKQGSGILSSMSQANCFIVLGHNRGDVSAGDSVEVEPFFGLV